MNYNYNAVKITLSLLDTGSINWKLEVQKVDASNPFKEMITWYSKPEEWDDLRLLQKITSNLADAKAELEVATRPALVNMLKHLINEIPSTIPWIWEMSQEVEDLLYNTGHA